MNHLRIATRASRLAMWQAEHLAGLLRQAHPGLEVSLVPMSTLGDERLDVPLYKLGGKGLFLKELEQAMLANRADVAAHSAKDVPAQLPDGFVLAAALQRHDARDALVCRDAPGTGTPCRQLGDLPQGARLGTSSLRRACQLRNACPWLEITPVRGNLDTRLRKLDAGQYDALVLACAGIERLGLAERISARLPTSSMLPAIGQGIIVVETLASNSMAGQLLQSINHTQSWHELCAERAFGEALQADCHMPLAAFARSCADGQIELRALVSSPDAKHCLRGRALGSQPLAVGRDLARQLLSQGALQLMAEGEGAGRLGKP